MIAKEKAALLAKGEKTLKMLEGIFDRFLQEGRYDAAWDTRAQYLGATTKLEDLGLITAVDGCNRTEALFEQYKDVKYPSRPKEAC